MIHKKKFFKEISNESRSNRKKWIDMLSQEFSKYIMARKCS